MGKKGVLDEEHGGALRSLEMGQGTGRMVGIRNSWLGKGPEPETVCVDVENGRVRLSLTGQEG